MFSLFVMQVHFPYQAHHISSPYFSCHVHLSYDIYNIFPVHISHVMFILATIYIYIIFSVHISHVMFILATIYIYHKTSPYFSCHVHLSYDIYIYIYHISCPYFSYHVHLSYDIYIIFPVHISHVMFILATIYIYIIFPVHISHVMFILATIYISYFQSIFLMSCSS